MMPRPLTILCLASYEKGYEFLRECKAQGCRVLLVTLDSLRDMPWPHEALDEVYYMLDMYDRTSLVNAISYLARTEHIDRIVPLDDFDVEMAALLREHLRVPGMGETTARFFRDKLAMRVKAQAEGIRVPPFCPVLNYDELHEFMATTAAPWVLKPRSEASAVGIRKVHTAQELWRALDELGDRQSFYVLEKYIPGDVFHVDSIVQERDILFAECHRYAAPPLDVMHGGGIFCTTTVRRGSEQERALHEQNRRLLNALGLVRGVTHTEFIRCHDDGHYYFLETAARVGGANIAETIEAATGINLWREWARVEIAGSSGTYQVPPARQDYAGVVISLARQARPDTSAYDYPELVWRLDKEQHVGLIVASPDAERVAHLLDELMRRVAQDFHASMPAPDKPTS